MKIRFIIIVFLVSLKIGAQNMSLDPSFGNSNGIVISNSETYIPFKIFYENNKYLIVMTRGKVISKNSNGSVDATFGVNGSLTYDSTTNLRVLGAKLKDGFIYIFGQSYISSATYDSFIVKLSTAGVLDSTFGTNGKLIFDFGVNDEKINDIIIMDSGEIFATGRRDKSIFLAKITSMGALDTSFNSIGYTTYPFPGLEVSTGGSIYLQGSDFLIVGSTYDSSSMQSQKYLALLKINQNGNLITSFGTNGKKTIVMPTASTGMGAISSYLAPNNDLFFHYSASFAIYTTSLCLGKYNLNTESLIEYFVGLPNTYVSYGIDSSNKVFITGYNGCSPPTEPYCHRDFLLQKRNSDGTADISFNLTGSYTYSFFPSDVYSDDQSTAFYLHDDGKIAIAGKTSNPSTTNGSGFAMIRIGDSLLNNTEFDNENFSVFPNPAKEDLFINNIDNKIITGLTVCDIYGKKILEQKENFETLNISSLETGIYFLKLNTETKQTVLKFIKN